MIYFKRLTKTAMIPKRQSEGAAGFDLHADEDTQIWPNEQKVISTGIMSQIGSGRVGIIKPRSGLALRHEIDVRGGVIDQDYRGEIKVILRNEGNRAFTVNKGDRIAQMLVIGYFEQSYEARNLDNTERGEGGFGSSGK